MTIFLDDLSLLMNRYDGFLIDQWGVLHDGRQPYPGAVAALHHMKKQGKRIVLLSNSGRRKDSNAERLEHLGFAFGESYDALVTSGEVTADLLIRRHDPFFADLGRNCLLVGPDDVLDKTGCRIVSQAEEADFVLLASTHHPEFNRDDTLLQLGRAAKRNLPLVCSNPDMTAVFGGKKIESPGSFAHHYAQLGGRVRLVGKPRPEVYDTALAAVNLPEDRIAVIGDSLEHDIAGGNERGLSTVFVMGGIHADILLAGREAYRDRLPELVERTGVTIDYALPFFRWGQL